MSILADIGGTYARFGGRSEKGVEHIKKYKAQDFESFRAALAQYCSDQNIQPGPIRIATAAYEDAGVWKFVNQNKWIIDPATLKEAGWTLEVIMNDFEAATWALLNLECGDVQTLKGGSDNQAARCLLGPGTGLGLGYLRVGDKPFVQKTHGGHMPVAALTDEQCLVVQTVQRLKSDSTIPVFENFVSGGGLHNIYTALCLMGGKEGCVDTPEAMLEQADDPEVQGALRLFHEFFGLFAATCVITGHAYGGLYLTGGVLERLSEAGRFDFECFEKWFCLNGAASVTRDLEATPIVHVTYPYPALKGLINA